MKSIHSQLESFKQFPIDFSTKKKQGFDLIDLKFSGGDGIAAYGNNIGKRDDFSSQTIWDTSNSVSDLEKTIAANKAKGYELTDLDYGGGGGWFSIYASEENDSELIKADKYADIEEQLLDLQDLTSSSSVNYQIIDIEYNSKSQSYIAIANVIAGGGTYKRSENFTEFQREIERQSDLGFELTNLEYAENDYIGIYNRDLSGRSDYTKRPYTDIDDFATEIENNRDRGYHLVNTETINGSWFGIYKQDTDASDPLVSSPSTSTNPFQKALIDMATSRTIGDAFTPS